MLQRMHKTRQELKQLGFHTRGEIVRYSRRCVYLDCWYAVVENGKLACIIEDNESLWHDRGWPGFLFRMRNFMYCFILDYTTAPCFPAR